MYGLLERDLKFILEAISRYPEIEEYPLPYFFDIVNYNDIEDKEFKHHIDSVGKAIWKK